MKKEICEWLRGADGEQAGTKKIKALFAAHEQDKFISLTDDEMQEMQDAFELLSARDVVQSLSIDVANAYAITGNLDLFFKWLDEQKKGERKLSRREWMIAIIGSAIGAIIGLIPWLLTILNSSPA